jgi:hypothetical protein
MYGRVFEHMYEGSMVGAGINVFAVWNYMLAKARKGVVEVNPALVAFKLGGDKGDVERALEFLQQPDPQSRSKAEEGRRIIKEGQFQYRIVNWAHYEEIRNEAERREYNRIAQAKHREKVAKEVETPKDTQKPNKFQKPTHADLVSEGLPPHEASKFLNHYESVGWKVGKNPIKNWKAAVAGWKSRLGMYESPATAPKGGGDGDLLAEAIG